jgi:hypothetical protein
LGGRQSSIFRATFRRRAAIRAGKQARVKIDRNLFIRALAALIILILVFFFLKSQLVNCKRLFLETLRQLLSLELQRFDFAQEFAFLSLVVTLPRHPFIPQPGLDSCNLFS